MSQIKVEYINHCGHDLSVVDAARCSFDKLSDWEYPSQFPEENYKDPDSRFYRNELGGFQRLKSSDEKLIKYLATHKHFSPFNHSFISVRVKAPVFVARQLVKHKFMPWNEVSRRYVKGEVEFYTPEYWREGSDNVKQGSVDEDAYPPSMSTHNASWYGDINDYHDSALNYYNHLIENNVCAEQARQVLPQSMMTTWIWSGTLGAFCDMLKLRLDSHTQYETRIVAQEVAKIVKELFPVSYEALVGVE